jgi:hypothetical protein
LSKLQDSAHNLENLRLFWLHGPENTVVEVWHLAIEGIVPQLQRQAYEELKQVRVSGQVVGLFYTTPDKDDPLACGKPMEAVYSGHDVLLKLLVGKVLVECPRTKIG